MTSLTTSEVATLLAVIRMAEKLLADIIPSRPGDKSASEYLVELGSIRDKILGRK